MASVLLVRRHSISEAIPFIVSLSSWKVESRSLTIWSGDFRIPSPSLRRATTKSCRPIVSGLVSPVARATVSSSSYVSRAKSISSLVAILLSHTSTLEQISVGAVLPKAATPVKQTRPRSAKTCIRTLDK